MLSSPSPRRGLFLDIRLVAVTGALTHDIAEAGKVEMRPGHTQTVGGDAIERSPPRIARGLWIDVEHQRRFGTWDLHGRQVNNVAPDQQAIRSGMDVPAGMAGRVTRQQRCRNARQ